MKSLPLILNGVNTSMKILKKLKVSYAGFSDNLHDLEKLGLITRKKVGVTKILSLTKKGEYFAKRIQEMQHYDF